MSERPTTNRWAHVLALLLLGCLVSGAHVSSADVSEEETAENLKKADGVSLSYYSRPSVGPVLSTSDLESILAELQVPTSATLSMWDQIRDWLSDFIRDRTDTGTPDWLEDFRLSATTSQWIFYITCLLIVALSLAVVINEVRHARAKRRLSQSGSESRPDSRQSGTGAPDEFPQSPAEIPLLDLPAYLLGLLIANLQPGETPVRRASLTHRELIQATGALDLQSRNDLISVANVAERIRFAGARPDSEEVEQAVTTGRKLIDTLGDPSS